MGAFETRKVYFIFADGTLCAIAYGYKNKDRVMSQINDYREGSFIYSFNVIDSDKLKFGKKIKMTVSTMNIQLRCKIGTHSSDVIFVASAPKIGESFFAIHTGKRNKFVCDDIIRELNSSIFFLSKI